MPTQLHLKQTLHGHTAAVSCITTSASYNLILSGSKVSWGGREGEREWEEGGSEGVGGGRREGDGERVGGGGREWEEEGVREGGRGE